MKLFWFGFLSGILNGIVIWMQNRLRDAAAPIH